ncbi:hypothetical protein OVA21_17865 [Dietzia sp. SL131]|uniref:hypothetical protein n=1 Tax=Dietzia sp. SL131 TaxID=2995149 RepID=UPI00227BE7D3|nr:hypothetical protein [Dietzia sp. SL131]MCY1659031.1 hypothetical protein [Dietzia sp. SL131]
MTHPFARAERELVPGHWLGPAAVLALGCATAWTLIGFGHGAPLAAAVLVTSLLLALWNSPLRASGHEPLRAVRSVADAGRAVVVLWRPGCPYSSALRRRAAREGLEVHWVNIWRDEDAYQLCCRINGGSQETPTAMLLDGGLAAPVVIPASVPGIREATAAPARAVIPTRVITPASVRPRSLGVRGY